MEKIKLNQLNINVRNAAITALVICKQNFRVFDDQKAVMEISVRDSENDYTNVTIWGSEQFIDEYYNSLKINDLVMITHPQIKSLSEECTFSPKSSSLFALTVNEGYGEINVSDNREEQQKLVQLAKIPISNGSRSLVTLSDLSAIAKSTTRKFVDVLVCVRSVSPLRQITTKLGKALKIREVIVFDQSSSGMLLSMFNEHYAETAENWISFNTILYLNDVQVDYSDFHHKVILKIAKKCLITKDPICRRSRELALYAANAPRDMDVSFGSETGVPDLSTITHVMSVRHLYELGQTERENEEQFTALLYAVVTKYEIDNSNQSRVVGKRCLKCKSYVALGNEICDNEDCQIAFYDECSLAEKFEYYYDVKIRISDHSGTINCKILKEYAEKLFGCSAKDFLNLDERRKIDLKMIFWMERCAVKVVLRRKSVLRSNMAVIVLECLVADFDDVTRKITVY